MPFLTIFNAAEIYYEILDGDVNQPYLIFLHEGLGCTAMWKDFPGMLCRETGCPGIVYDRCGYGKSSPLAGPMTLHFMHHNAFVELPAVISKLIPDKHFFLIGHSDGGSISLIFASEKPSRLQGIITEGAHVFNEKETVDGIRIAVENFNSGKLRKLIKYHGEKTDTIFKAWSRIWLSEGFKYWNIEYLLPSIECPILALQGMEDRYGTAAQVTSITSKAPHARQIIMERCGHAPHKGNADETLRVMKKFVEAASDSKPT